MHSPTMSQCRGLSRPLLTGTFLLSDLSPTFLQPPSVQVAHGGLSCTSAAEMGAEYSMCHSVRHAKMHTTETISGERHPHAEVILKPASQEQPV